MDTKTEKFLQSLDDKGLYRDDYDYSKVVYVDRKSKVIIFDENDFEHHIAPSNLFLGSKLTSMSALNKNEYFIFKAKQIHGDKYNYSLVDYKSITENIIILDENDIKHTQSPQQHLNCKSLSIQSAINKNDYFIFKAKQMHGDKYEYNKVDYINTTKQVVIICKIHGDFLQTPDNHLSGQGCNKCSGNQKSNTKDFITRAKEIYGDKYDYSLVDYNSSNKKITIIDQHNFKHQIRPINFLNGNKLSFNSVINKTDYFIFKANQIHGDKYDYSLVKYKKSNENINIICRIHGAFQQTPNSHLSGSGCQECGGSNKSNTDEFIKKAKEIHGEIYDYSLVEYKNIDEKIIIVDESGFKHEQSPYSHLKNCKLSINSAIDKNDYFIKKANEVHSNKYNYSLVNYNKNDDKVIIICKEHGKFPQRPSSHLSAHVVHNVQVHKN